MCQLHIFKCRFFVKETLTSKMPLHACFKGVLIASAIAWSCGVVRLEEILVLSASFFAKFRWRRFSKVAWPAKATPGVIMLSYLRNYCRYVLNMCLNKWMKTTVSENKMRFKVIQKMPAQLDVSTTFLTAPRIWLRKRESKFSDLSQVRIEMKRIVRLGVHLFIESIDRVVIETKHHSLTDLGDCKIYTVNV